MLERVRETVARWARRGHAPATPATLLFADHDEIQDIARQMARTKIEIDRSVLTMRSWARDLGRRLEDSRGTLSRDDDLRSLGETVGGLAHNLNNSLAAILAYSELMLRDEPTGTAKRRLSVMRDVALEASATVRRLQEFVSRQPQVAFGPVGLPAVIAQAVEMTAPRWRDEAQRRGISIVVTQDMEALPPVEGNAFELRDALMRLILNAVTAMPEGGALGIRAASEESGWVVVEVRDTGVGMPLEMQRRIAERAKSLAPGRGGRAPGSSRSPTSWSATAARSASRAKRARARSSGCGCTPAASRSSPPPAGSPIGASGRGSPRGCSSWTMTRGSSPCCPTCCAGRAMP